jgi:hypothetical protein
MVRKGPSKSATLFKNGTIKAGNDGNKWIIVTNKSGVRRWQRMKSASIVTRTKTVKNKPEKSKRVLEMEADPSSVWGKNKPLEEFWQSLASGKKVVLVQKTGGYKIFTMPSGKMAARKMFNAFDDDSNIVAVLSSNMSQDAYETNLYPKAKDKTVEYVISNYKKYFKSAGPMPADLVAKGIPAQKKVLLPS